MDGQEVTRLETTYLPGSNENLIRMYGADGELIHEQIMAMDLGREIMPTRVEYGHGEMRYDGDTGVLEWRAAGTPVYYEQAMSSNEYVAVGRNLDIDMLEWDREQDAHHSVYRQEYRQAYDDAYYGNPYVRRYVESLREEDAQRLERVFCFGEWDTSDNEDEPEIKAERGGALDEFIDGLKPQETTPERSDEQK